MEGRASPNREINSKIIYGRKKAMRKINGDRLGAGVGGGIKGKSDKKNSET